jgi:hypothetical protein
VARELDIQAGPGVRTARGRCVERPPSRPQPNLEEFVRHLPVVSTALAVCALGASLAHAQTLLGVRTLPPVLGRQLVSLDPATGGVTAPGPLIDPPLAGEGATTIDRAGNRLFMLGFKIGETDQRVYSIDLQTGTVLASPTLVGSGTSFGALEWDAGEGVLFGLRSTGDFGRQLASIDPATGAFTNIGTPIPPGPVALGTIAGASTLDASGNRFFFVGFRLDDNVLRLFVVDTATGAVTEPAIPSGIANPVVDLEWDAGEGVLYALHNANDASRQLATIDPVTADVTPLGTGTGVPLDFAGISALDEAGNRFFIVGTIFDPLLGEKDARLYSFDTADGSVDANPTIIDSFALPFVGIEWEPTPLPVTLLGLTVE